MLQDVRDEQGHLLFKFDPEQDVIELKQARRDVGKRHTEKVEWV